MIFLYVFGYHKCSKKGPVTIEQHSWTQALWGEHEVFSYHKSWTNLKGLILGLTVFDFLGLSFYPSWQTFLALF